MSEFTELKIAREFTSKETGVTYGVYHVVFKGNPETFIRNGNSVGAVCFYHDKTASQCVSTIRDDVKEKFFAFLENEASK